MKVNVLVTGCGGDIGQSIGKILNKSTLVNNLYGCDISNKNAGQFIYSNFFVGLPYKDSSYLSSLEAFIEDKEIDFIIPMAEPELRYFSETNNLTSIGRAKMLTASAEALRIGFDKLETANFLKNNNFPFPNTVLASEEESPKFPVILKSRTGSGSASVYKVDNLKDYNYLRSKHNDFIAQEFLEDSLGEYTCGVFRTKSGDTKTITFKRELTGGYSGYGEVVNNESINNLLLNLATKINLEGSINVQLRLTKKGPVVFEINPRFSSTVLFRHMFGFKDLEWSIKDKLNEKIEPYKAVEEGRKFYKGFNEYIS
ncbi:ATP-grasp domain-containing protein [Algibacter sp. PT7-4]|uniref:ATP-grasp domain-containing protein n=1 Tax=Algibacter ulvanivorans TaxID=3400999 RepID=UPI003AAD709E